MRQNTVYYVNACKNVYLYSKTQIYAKLLILAPSGMKLEGYEGRRMSGKRGGEV